MLANGITLSCKRSTESNYSILAGLKEVPELGNEPEKVENTGLSDTVKQYEFGIGDPGDLEYKFKFSNTVDSPYRKMKAAEASKEICSFKETLPDGTSFSYDAQVSVKVSSGAVNGVMEFTLKMALQSAITVTDPA
nr:MAG TPA: tail tube protein [Caudoviricetes sp.]